MNGVTEIALRDFPELLREIPNPPKKLYVRGNLPGSEVRYLAVVGSRACTSYGKAVLEHLLEGLCGYPIVVVSGLAYGIDALAHQRAIELNIPTIAVPGSGLDWSVLYPRAHVRLAQQILESGGAIISEFAHETKAAEWTFPKRNRIMAGMCHATLVIEAREKSGSLITARLAADYNRELLVVPGSIFSSESAGTHQFLKLGATPITESADILRALRLEERAPAQTLRSDVSDSERTVLTLLQEPRHRDELLSHLALPIPEAIVLLSTMEIKGLIKEELGFVRIA